MRKYSMTSHKRRNHQRWLNSYIRAWNKGLENDELWQGRFKIEQVSTQMEWFDDNSGGIMHCLLRFRDKKTKKETLWYTDCVEVEWKMWLHMNDFIVKDCAVWENENPYEEKRDWRNEK